MIKSVTVKNPSNEELKLELTNPESSGLIIEAIDGLGPADANINTTDLAVTDGSVFNSARQQERNIVLTLQMMFAPTIEDARLKTYRFFPVKKPIQLTIETDRHTVYTTGYVEHNQPDIFSENESTQISIICPDPFFYDLESSSFGFYGVHPKFTFPFTNEVGTDTLVFGEIRFDTRLSLDYQGSADTGAVFILTSFGPTTDITLYDANTRGTMKVAVSKIEQLTGTAFGKGDKIFISTVKGEKYVRLLRNGVYTNAIKIINRYPDWFQLQQGENVFGFLCDEDTTGTITNPERNVQLELTYKNAYSGV